MIFDLRSTIHDPRSTIHDPRSTIHDPRSTIHDPRSPIFDPRSSISYLDGSWVKREWKRLRIENCGLWIEEEEKINRQAAKHAKGRKKGAQAFLGVQAFLPESSLTTEHGHSCPCLSSSTFRAHAPP
jgi:hypothetical protein